MRGSWPADLGRIARQRRVDLEWSQEELASKAEVTRQWLTRFETGKGDPSLSKVLRVLRELGLYLDVTPEERAASVRPRVTVPVYKAHPRGHVPSPLRPGAALPRCFAGEGA
ncbi:helix-turn-helix transcriptional regulator [Clavibacter zhangzhiyongii]|uniref:helix-turn-helix transcriptional regulator n=1 Tax=Clavibacter zhangzhiyongii TaxID=2768071 RepID=UPI0039DFA142